VLVIIEWKKNVLKTGKKNNLSPCGPSIFTSKGSESNVFPSLIQLSSS